MTHDHTAIKIGLNDLKARNETKRDSKQAREKKEVKVIEGEVSE